MGDIIDNYQKLYGIYDEMCTEDGTVRSQYRNVIAGLLPLASTDIRERGDRLARAFTDEGVTFDIDGEERPFPLDVVPRVFDSAEWKVVEEGVRQRVKTLEAFLADIYGPGRVFEAGLIPKSMILNSPSFLRAASGIKPANGVRIHVAGIDIVRDETGRLCVLEDNIRCPSGVSYVLANRRAMARVLPELFTGEPIGQVSDYPAHLISALRAAAPKGIKDPTVVVLTPGIFNSAFYEHALLARMMGVELVEGRDLVCRGVDVFLRTTDGEIPVHVVYRRLDDDYLDPLHFRPESIVGCPGIVNSARAGRVTIANAVGNGIGDDKLVYSFMPDLIRYYLKEDPILSNIKTYRIVNDEERKIALSRMQELVWKRVDGSGGKGMVIGPEASKEELELLREQVEYSPRDWIAQRLVRFSTAPTWIDGKLQPRHVDLRPFAVNDGEKIWVLQGGLSRVALQEGGLVVNSSQGGGSKDTWVIARSPTFLSHLETDETLDRSRVSDHQIQTFDLWPTRPPMDQRPEMEDAQQ